MNNAETELASRGIKITQGKWLSTDFSGYDGAAPRSAAGNAVVKEPTISGKAIAFVAASAGFIFVVPILLASLTGGDDVLMIMLRCFVLLVAALMVWSRKRLFIILGWAVSGLFASGSLTSLVGGSGTKGLIGLLSLAAAFALAWFGAPLFRKNEIAVSHDQFVYGQQPSEWGRGSSDSTRSGIWVMGLLLNRLVRIPGIYVFHGLKSPGARSMDVEHAVTHGNNVYLIDSWLELSTNYSWHPNRKGLPASSNGDDGHRHTKIADAADRYRAALGTA